MAFSTTLLYHHLLILVLFLFHAPPCPAAGGSWSILLLSIGISAMHMQLLPNDRVIMYDRTDFGVSNISLPNGKCCPISTNCSAHSVEYDAVSNTIRPLMVLTNVWCSSGTLMPDGRLVQTGGWADGYRRVRIYKTCSTCDWNEIPNGLNQQRWYATNHLLPDGRQIIIGGCQAFNYEFYPKMSASENSPSFPFLVQSNDPNVENNLYPFVFLYPDGNLFVFANNRAILFKNSKNQVVKTYPTMPSGQPRNYPLVLWNPVLSPVTYRPDNKIGSRFEVENPSTKPRVYHSTTVLLRDGRVLVGGSNLHDKYVFTNVLYPTELSLEAFCPSYLDSSSSSLRPRILSPKSKTKIRYGKRVDVTFVVSGRVEQKSVAVTLVSPSFDTHSFSMNHRLLLLDSGNSTKARGKSNYKV
ncbi:putative galactose oxidase [Helianthus anomalus]